MIPAEISQPEPLLEDELDTGDRSVTIHLANHTQLIDDFDNALCCAFDTETLEEIREEFQPKIDALGSDFIEHAGRIFLRHEQRVQRLTIPITDEAPDSGLAGHINHRAFSVRTRHLNQRARRSKGTPSLSLLALNARQRLSAIRQQPEEERSADSDQTKGEALEDVSIITWPTAGLLNSQQPHSHSVISIQEPDTVQASDT
jgi:hypothetical protein